MPYSSGSHLTRPEWTDTDSMSFWNVIFPECMLRLVSLPEPKGRSQSLYNIRNKKDWHSVYDTLMGARQKYQESGGWVGKLRKVRRKAADNATAGVETAKVASKVVPQDNVATPVVGAVEVVLLAFKASATVRNQVLSGFDDIVPIFSDVELFLTMFDDDTNIRNASTDLVVTTLVAVERAIGFFVSNEFARGGKALFSGGDYQKDLTNSLEMILTRSKNLMQQAERSHFFESHVFHQESRQQQVQLLSKVGIAVDATNSINHLLSDHLQEKERHLRRVQLELEAARQENVHLRVENGILRSTSPEQLSMWLPPQQQTHGSITSWYVSQSTLRQLVDTYDLDLTDGAVVNDKKEQLPTKERSRAEQIVNTPLFRNWIVSASSAKLLIHWDTRPPKTIAEVSPLSVFCMTLTQSLRARNQFLSVLWFCGQHMDRNGPDIRVGGRAMVLSLIDQLLRQYQFDTGPLHMDMDSESLQEGDVKVLTGLLTFLVRQLPPAMTVFFIIDGVVLFEREEFEEEASSIFLALIQLVADTTLMVSVKLLFTSTPGTDLVRCAFEEEDLILNVDGLPTQVVPSEARLIRELGEMDGVGE